MDRRLAEHSNSRKKWIENFIYVYTSLHVNGALRENSRLGDWNRTIPNASGRLLSDHIMLKSTPSVGSWSAAARCTAAESPRYVARSSSSAR